MRSSEVQKIAWVVTWERVQVGRGIRHFAFLVESWLSYVEKALFVERCRALKISVTFGTNANFIFLNKLVAFVNSSGIQFFKICKRNSLELSFVRIVPTLIDYLILVGKLAIVVA